MGVSNRPTICDFTRLIEYCNPLVILGSLWAGAALDNETLESPEHTVQAMARRVLAERHTARLTPQMSELTI